jgi:cysteinylglycine-S-conjugate dipeptidase
MSDAWGAPAVRIGSGGSIPLVSVLQNVCPNAGVLIFGAEDSDARIHSSNESVDPSEIQHAVVAEALFMARLAKD